MLQGKTKKVTKVTKLSKVEKLSGFNTPVPRDCIA
jgi:hypothetical protein